MRMTSESLNTDTQALPRRPLINTNPTLTTKLRTNAVFSPMCP